MRVGVLGGGQLGRMLGLAGRAMGIECRFLDPDEACPASAIGELVVGAYDDGAALARLAAGVDAVTVEFENVPAAAAERLAGAAPFFPGARALATAQDRLLEKRLFAGLGIETPRFEAVGSRDELAQAAERVGLPAVLKTRRMGYDGKGQRVIRVRGELDGAWSALSPGAASGGLILESFVAFERELSVISVWGKDGAGVFYPLTENVHESGILRLSRAPALGVDAAMESRAREIAGRIARELGYVGVLAVELFQSHGGRLVANEMACRVHNSGHWTIEGAECSQFENHLRAGLGLPLGSAAARGVSAMVNVIGAMPRGGALRAVLSVEGAHVHDYGKPAREGRKVGHVTVTAADEAQLDRRLAVVAAALGVRTPCADQR